VSCACGRHKTPQGCAGARHLAALAPERKVRQKRVFERGPRKRNGGTCRCGCGRQCTSPRNKYATPACYPRAIRVENGRRNGTVQAQRVIQKRFKEDVRQVVDKGRITAGDLFAKFQEIYERGRQSEYMKLIRRHPELKRTA
jgi:hypothetical protein